MKKIYLEIITPIGTYKTDEYELDESKMGEFINMTKSAWKDSDGFFTYLEDGSPITIPPSIMSSSILIIKNVI